VTRDDARGDGPDGAGRDGAGRNGGGEGKQGADRHRGGRPLAPPAGEAWGIVGSLVAGGGFWGLVGFGVDRWLGYEALFFPIGLIVGIAGAIYLVIYRFGARR
jgi:hypothetical protein